MADYLEEKELSEVNKYFNHCKEVFNHNIDSKNAIYNIEKAIKEKSSLNINIGDSKFSVNYNDEFLEYILEYFKKTVDVTKQELVHLAKEFIKDN